MVESERELPMKPIHFALIILGVTTLTVAGVIAVYFDRPEPADTKNPPQEAAVASPPAKKSDENKESFPDSFPLLIERLPLQGDFPLPTRHRT
jgi:hypothetical protein